MTLQRYLGKDFNIHYCKKKSLHNLISLSYINTYNNCHGYEVRNEITGILGNGVDAHDLFQIGQKTSPYLLSTDHSQLLRNTIRWALNEEPIVGVETQGIVDVTVWRQKSSMTVHLVNLTNPMMMKGPFRELFPVEAKVSIKVPENKRVTGVSLLMSGTKPAFENKAGRITLNVPKILDHEIVALDLA
jgi:hypothetical protein